MKGDIMARTANESGQLEHLSTRVPSDLLEWIDGLAEADRRTRSQMTVILLEEVRESRERKAKRKASR